MIIRYQMLSTSRLAPWRALRLAVTLMRRLEPEATLIVRAQGEVPDAFRSDLEKGARAILTHSSEPGIRGRHTPPRWNSGEHEVWCDNDHIMWKLPLAWEMFKKDRKHALLWEVPWAYYGRYDGRVAGQYSAGMWGLPPGCDWRTPPEEAMDDSDEMGWTIREVQRRCPQWLTVTYEEVSCYCPEHPVLAAQASHLGSCGTHLMSLNRGWNAAGERMLNELEERYL